MARATPTPLVLHCPCVWSVQPLCELLGIRYVIVVVVNARGKKGKGAIPDTRDLWNVVFLGVVSVADDASRDVGFGGDACIGVAFVDSVATCKFS